MKKHLLNASGIGAALLFAAPAFAGDALPAFPGAEGFGRFATGGRGGEIYHVTNLNDNGKGSLRDAVSQPNRIIVFDVSGVINLKSRLVFKSNQTILGQTAPGEGVQVYGNGVSFSNANNIIVRYLRIRMGVNGDNGKDAAGVAEGHDMIFDHMSVLWGRDENFSVSSNNKGTGPANVTIQNSIIGQGLQPHSCGGLIQTDNGVTLFRNLYIENSTRNPKVKGLNQFVNNVLYNWGKEAAYNMGGDSAGESWAEISDNYWVAGPWKGAKPLVGGNDNFKYVGFGNYYDENRNGVCDGHEMTDEEYASSGGYRLGDVSELPAYGARQEMPPIAGRTTAPEALEQVLAHAGASLPVRDEVDRYLIGELASFGTLGSTTGITTEKALPHKGTGTLYGGFKPLDSDGDGIPDEWEKANGLNPDDPADAAAIAANGYANIENYSFTLDGPYPYIKNPTNLKAVRNEKNSIIIRWDDNSDDETGFVAEVSADGVNFAEAGRTEAGATELNVAGLDENKLYYFRVKALGEGGMESVWSPMLQTMTSEPFRPDASTVVAPENGGKEKVLDVVLRWENGTREYFGKTTYNVWLGAEGEDLQPIAEGMSETSLKPGELKENTTYSWRVDAVNDIGMTEGEIWTFTTVPGGVLFYTDFHTTPASFADSEWGTIIAGNQADIIKGKTDEKQFDNLVMGTDGGRLVAFGNLSPYAVYSSDDKGASKNAVGFIGKQGKVDKSYIQVNDIEGPWTVTVFCGNSDKSAQSVILSNGADNNGDGVVDAADDLAVFKFRAAEKKTFKFTYTYEGTEAGHIRIDRASIANKGINFHDILVERYVKPSDTSVGVITDGVQAAPEVYVAGDAVSVNGLPQGAIVRVSDLSGRTVLSERSEGGSLGFVLARGVYVVAVEGMRPVKVAVF